MTILTHPLKPLTVPSPSSSTGPLRITIRTGSGRGLTSLSAFDHALIQAGVGDFNLIALSSVIPQHAVLEHTNERHPGGHGDRLYCVLATAHADGPGEIGWAGLGWARDPRTSKGLFVEHHAGSEESLLEQIHLSLADLSQNRGGIYTDTGSATVSAHYEDGPACAVAVAAYTVSGWDTDE